MELWDAYDKDMNIIKGLTLVRGEPFSNDNIFHMVVDIGVIHRDGTYLLMKRDLNKTHPGEWEFTAGGSVIKGEKPIEAAYRELKEETGIIGETLIEVGRSIRVDRHAIYVLYLCHSDCSKDSVILQKGETIDYQWVNKDDADILVTSDDLKRTYKYI